MRTVAASAMPWAVSEAAAHRAADCGRLGRQEGDGGQRSSFVSSSMLQELQLQVLVQVLVRRDLSRDERPVCGLAG